MKTFTVKGTWEQMGRALGQAQKKTITRIFRNLRITERFLRLANGQTIYLSRIAPDAVSFMRGMSDGSGQSFEKLIAFLSWQDWILDIEHCSTILGSEGGEWFVAHNEDYDPLFRHALSLVSFCPTRGPQFISTHYAGTLPGDGVALNQYGFCVSMNNIWRKRMPVTIGWTMQTIGFAFMQCRSWHEVLKIYRKVQANAGMHYLVVQGSEKAMSMEFFPDRKARRAVQPGFVHTNHPMLPEMRKGASVSANSKQRFMILSEQDASSLTNVRNCLRIPFGKGGVKRVFSKSGDDLTLATAIIIPGRRKLQIC